MKRVATLLGDHQELFGMFIGDLGVDFAMGLVLILTDSIAHSRVWMRVASASAQEGIPCLIVEAPGVGLNSAVDRDELVPAIKGACSALRSQGANKVAVATTSEAAIAALKTAVVREDVVGVMTIGLPEADSTRKLARSIPAAEYLRRGLRLSSVHGLLDGERRRRYLQLIRAKVVNAVWRDRASGEESSGLGALRHEPGVSELLDAIESGARVLVAAGHDDKGLRVIRNLQDRAAGGGLSGLQIDSSFPGRLARLDKVASHDWIVGVSGRWLNSLILSPTVVSSLSRGGH